MQVLTARLAELETRLNKDSHNSHQPPSSDGPAKRPHPRSLRKSSGKKRGGQAGHPGVTRCLVTDPDLIVEHVPAICSGCGASLAAAPEVSRERRQVIEIPKPQPEITEHQAVRLACPACEHVTSGEFPPRSVSRRNMGRAPKPRRCICRRINSCRMSGRSRP